MSEYKSEEAVVAFIDILGSSQEMKKDPQNALNTIHNAYDDALRICKTILKGREDNVHIKIFSDNIVLSCPIEKLGLENAAYLTIVLSALVQESLLHYGVLSRGGIAQGDFFNDEVMIWGNALVQAYNLECEIAIYPRIIIHPDLIGELDYHRRKENDWDELADWIAQDQDGLCYVDYINVKYMRNPSFLLTVFIGDNVKRQAEHLENIKVIQKMIWHGNYLKNKLTELDDVDDTETA